jgi:hypothetical protein
MKLPSLLFAFLLLSLTSFGQDINQLYPRGKYRAECPMEVMDKASFRHCELCPFMSVSKSDNTSMTSEIQLDFGTDSLTLIQRGKITKVPYTRDTNDLSIRFRFSEKDYFFRVFIHNDQYILESAEGLLVVLTKAAEK